MSCNGNLLVYGVPFSQPVRAVMWLLLYKQHPFQMVPINPGSKGDNGSRNPAFLAKNPSGTIPCIEETDSGFTLGEAHAIMPYLCIKHGWDDVYPADPHQRALVDSYLHYHHRNVRDASPGLVAPKVRKDLDIPESFQQGARRTLSKALDTLENGWLSDSTFLVGDTVTIADMAAYVEIGQLQPQFTNLWDFSTHPNVSRWLEAMQQVEGHDLVHTALVELGDISQEAPSMEQIVGANKAAMSALKQHLSEMSAHD